MLRRSLAALIVLAAVGRPAAAAEVADILRHEEVTLRNGMRVLLLRDDRMPSIAIITWYRVGSGDNLRGKTGLAHLFEHLMFKGSPNVPDGVIDKIAEEAGGSTNAYTATDATVYFDVGAPTVLERMLWAEGDRLARLDEAIDQPKLDNQRDVVLNERRQNYENRPYGEAEILLGEALWPPGHPNHAPGIGYVEDLKSVTLDDARTFFDLHYTPSNAVMVVAGDIDLAATRGWLEKYLGGIPTHPRPPSPPLPSPPPLRERKVLAAEDDVQVPRVYLRWRSVPGYSPEEAALDLATIILAGGKSSRLYQKLVVEERLAQDVYAGNSTEARAGEVTVMATVKPGVDADKVRAALDRELAALLAAPPTEAELERAKNTREADFMRGLAPIQARAHRLADYAANAGDANFLAKDLERYRAVTARDIQKAVIKYLRADAAVQLTITPRKAP
jgi:zinc protease